MDYPSLIFSSRPSGRVIDRDVFVDLKLSLLVGDAALDAMSPLRVLTRGYALAEHAEGGVIKSAAQLRPGDRVRLRFAEGSAGCTVDSVNKGEEEWLQKS